MTNKPATGALWGPERSATWTLDQIKDAFWAVFHESGELWFDYFSDDEATECTTQYWQEFRMKLDDHR